MPGKRRSNGEGTIYQRQDGRWEASYRALDGKKRSLYAPTQEEARRRLTQATSERDRGLPAPRDERQTVAVYLASWLEVVKNQVRDSGSISYEKRVRLYIVPRLGRVKLAQLGPQQVKELYAWMLNTRKLSPTTVNHTAGVLHLALKDAQRMGLVARNVCDLVDPPRKAKRKMQVYTPDQVTHLLDAIADYPYESIITLALTTGARLGELLALTWSNTDLEHGSIQISTGRAEVLDGWADTEPKTDAGNRAIALTAATVALLREHRRAQLEHRIWLGDAWQGGEYVFCNQAGGQLGHATVERAFKRIVLAAGLPVIRFHDLRHTAASLLLARGVPVTEVARMLGHSSPHITYKIYAHAIPDGQRQAVAAMEAIIARS
jgi:integrase